MDENLGGRGVRRVWGRGRHATWAMSKDWSASSAERPGPSPSPSPSGPGWYSGCHGLTLAAMAATACAAAMRVSHDLLERYPQT